MRHTVYEDAHGIISGAVFAAVGVAMLNAAGLVTGGVAGLALLASYTTGYSPGILFMMINAPFFLFGYMLMGLPFTVKSLIGSALIMGLLQIMPHVLAFDYVHPVVAALVGGTFCGMGVLALARHGAGLGGIGIVTMWMMKRHGINAGRSQMALDGSIVLSALIVVAPVQIAWSAASVVATSAMVMIWHRPGRYIGG